MPRSLTLPATTAERFELVFERKIKAILDTALSAVSQPDGFAADCAVETAESKPPAVVVAVRRNSEAIDRTGIWECSCALEFRFRLADTGYIEAIYAACRDAMGRDTAEGALTVSGETLVVAGSMMWDTELSRELAEGTESRFYAWRMFAGLVEP